MPGNVFISYRREDTAGYAGRLYDRLKAAFPGQVFIDVGEIPPGADFVKAIEEHIEGCVALIALIGANWTTHDRLQDPADFVRLEIASALKRNTTVIPVLVGAAKLPAAETLPEDVQPLLRHQTISISDEDWDHGCERLIQALQTVVGGGSKPSKTAGRWNLALAFTTKRWVLTFALGTMGLLAVAPVLYLRSRGQPQTSAQAPPAALPATTRAAENYDKSVAKGYDNAAKVMDDLANKIGGAGNASAPTITSISPDSAAFGAWVTITGTNFGASQGTSVVKFDFTEAARVKSWAATSITVQVPSFPRKIDVRDGHPIGATKVVVSVGGVDSAAADFMVSGS